ncbi:hypothetical protein R0381_001422 [Jeongeupia wiesaeckerbachi]|uniref:hypothetical protein n=1 Tax=Jeongeupia wiesaeckerbachi TaxID=3051218 RepID=UPI003D808ADF
MRLFIVSKRVVLLIAVFTMQMAAADSYSEKSRKEISDVVSAIYAIDTETLMYGNFSGVFDERRYCAIMEKYFFFPKKITQSVMSNRKTEVRDVFGNVVGSAPKEKKCDWVARYAMDFTHRSSSDFDQESVKKYPKPIIESMSFESNEFVRVGVVNALDFSKNPKFNFTELRMKYSDAAWKVCEIKYIFKPIRGKGGSYPRFELKKPYDGPDKYDPLGDYVVAGAC